MVERKLEEPCGGRTDPLLAEGLVREEAALAAVEDMLKIPESLEVLPVEASLLLAGRVDRMGADESLEPTVDRVTDGPVVVGTCRPGHSDTG